MIQRYRFADWLPNTSLSSQFFRDWTATTRFSTLFLLSIHSFSWCIAVGIQQYFWYPYFFVKFNLAIEHKRERKGKSKAGMAWPQKSKVLIVFSLFFLESKITTIIIFQHTSQAQSRYQHQSYIKQQVNVIKFCTSLLRKPHLFP